MEKDILTLLREGETSFSKGQRAIAHYIIESYDKAAFLTASKLGRTVGVSESTVVRFAVELGYSGYPAMQKAMQDMVLNRLTSVQRIEVANDRFAGQNVLASVLQSDAEKLRRTEETVDQAEFRAAVEAMLRARRIYILGARSAAPLAEFMGYYLNYMFDNVQVVTSAGVGEMFERIVRVRAGDVVFAFSFPRYSAATAKNAQYCRGVGATVIGMTDSRLSPLGESCDHVLLVKSGMVSMVDSLVAPLSVLNALIVALAAQRETALGETFGKLERMWEEYDVYEKRDDARVL